MGLIEALFSTPFHLSIGDPTLLGWFTAIGYLVASLLCAACFWRANHIFTTVRPFPHRLFWGSLSLALFFLGVNKQLDLQTWLMAVGRKFIAQQGWFENRQLVQDGLVVIFILLGILFLIGVAVSARRFWRHYAPLLFGILLLIRFLIVRIASFWNVPLPQLSRFTGGVHLNSFLELAGVAVIAISAGSNLLSSHKPAGWHPSRFDRAP